MGRLGPSGTPEDIALRQKMFQTQQQAGQGPQYQGLGRPQWQQVQPTEAISRANTMGGGAQLQNLGQAMGKSGAESGGKNPAGQAARQGGYFASQMGAMGKAWRQNPVPLEQPRWMGRG